MTQKTYYQLTPEEKQFFRDYLSYTTIKQGIITWYLLMFLSIFLLAGLDILLNGETIFSIYWILCLGFFGMLTIQHALEWNKEKNMIFPAKNNDVRQELFNIPENATKITIKEAFTELKNKQKPTEDINYGK